MTSCLPAIRIESIPEEFFIDLAVGVGTYLDICDNYNIDETAASQLENDPLFQRRLRIAQQSVEDDGSAFRARCRVAVSESVDAVLHMIKDPDVPSSTQLDAFKTLARFGGLEPAKVEAGNAGGPALVLNIVAPDGSNATLSTVNSPEESSVGSIIEGSASPVLDIEEPKAPKQVSTMFGAA
jgi:hypothetical protein